MLPSTGYFKTINCPFYEKGSCDRPYCHFKHARREDAAATAAMAGVVEAQAMAQPQAAKTSTVTASNSAMLQQLVTEAVKKVLAVQEVNDTEKFSKNIVSQVVEELKPTLSSASATSLETNTSNMIGKHISIPTTITQPCVYNPTPIAELKKRHIPVASYMLTRESRVAVKRKPSPERIKPWLSIVQEPTISKTAEVTYKPTAIVSTNEQDTGQTYIPMFKSDSSSSNSYEDSNSNDYVPKVKEAYYPKSKKRREEYVPRNVKAPLKNMQHIDDTVLDQFEPEFTMIDEILTAAHTVPSAPPSEESQDYCLDIEPKFSDDEVNEDILDSAKKPESSNNFKFSGQDIEEKQVSCESDRHNNRDVKPNNEKSIDKTKPIDSDLKSHKHNEGDQHKNKLKEDSNTKKNDDKNRKESKSNNKSTHKETTHRSSSGSKSKERHKHESSSRDKRHSLSHDKDRGKTKSSTGTKESSHKSREHSRSHKHKDADRDRKSRHKSNKHDKHKSNSTSTKSKSERHTNKTHHSQKHHSKSSRTSSSSSRKHNHHKESSSEKDIGSAHDEGSNSPSNSIRSFADAVFESSDSDYDVQEECLKIFEEYQVSDHPKVVFVKEDSKQDTDDAEDLGKKRVAHPSAATSVTRHVGPSQPPKKLPSAQQKMYERWRIMREAAAAKAAEKAAAVKAAEKVAMIAKTSVSSESAITSRTNKSEEPSDTNIATASNDVHLNGNGRVRIAHVPYATSVAMARKKASETINKQIDTKSIDKTVAQTTKGGPRVAHVPQMVPQLVRPEPLQATTQKFPLNVRQHYINMMHDICIQIYTNGEDAAQRALREEFACHERCKALSVYKNSCMLAAHRLRKEVDQAKADVPVPSVSGTVSHEAVLAGKSKGSWSVVKTKKLVVDFKGSALYSMLKKWILTEQQLRDNGFPRVHPDGPKGRAKVYVTNTRNQSILSKVPNERFCSRCGSAYMVNRYGLAVAQQNCIYHWGRKFTMRGESKYSCCQQYGSAMGCCDAKTHVWDHTDYENLRGYVRTLPKDVPVEEQGVYALDCEMCYTTQGLELTRVTVINDDCNVIYETLVKPLNVIIDYNTRFSGITEENMKDVTTSLLDVQATLLTMFSDKTILVGHSLESDFKALRLLHDTVVDTSVMFPHRNGYPQKRALKNLSSEYLRKLIQNDVGGHDSKEDAVACMELIRWKVKEEAKLQ